MSKIKSIYLCPAMEYLSPEIILTEAIRFDAVFAIDLHNREHSELWAAMEAEREVESIINIDPYVPLDLSKIAVWGGELYYMDK